MNAKFINGNFKAKIMNGYFKTKFMNGYFKPTFMNGSKGISLHEILRNNFEKELDSIIHRSPIFYD